MKTASFRLIDTQPDLDTLLYRIEVEVLHGSVQAGDLVRFTGGRWFKEGFRKIQLVEMLPQSTTMVLVLALRSKDEAYGADSVFCPGDAYEIHRGVEET